MSILLSKIAIMGLLLTSFISTKMPDLTSLITGKLPQSIKHHYKRTLKSILTIFSL